MNSYARIHDARVVELVRIDRDPAALFHPALDWRLVPGELAGRVGLNWVVSGSTFAPPPAVPEAEPPATVEALQAQIEALAAAVAALAKQR